MADLNRVETLDLSLGHYDWAFASERRVEIDAHFEKLRQQKPSMWNGRVLLMNAFEIAQDTLVAIVSRPISQALSPGAISAFQTCR